LTPYLDFVYFLFLLYPLLPTIVLGVFGRLGRRFVIVVTVVMVVFQVANPLGDPDLAATSQRQLVFLIAYAIGSVGLILGFARIRGRGKSQPIFYTALAIAIAPLVVVKVLPVAQGAHWFGLSATGDPLIAGATTIAVTAAPSATVSLIDAFGFVGISYVTFRVVDAIIVLHDGLAKEPPTFGNILGYLLFFPTISAGPIDRYLRFTNNLKSLPRSRGDYLLDIEAGIARVFQGFLYKFIIAYLINQYALVPASAMTGVLGIAAYAYAYIFYLFFDFAGYSAFAIGIGRFFGIRVPENFDAPFLSRNFREMWNRWHISLSTLLRDHIYMRFLLTATRRKWLGGNRNTINYVGLTLTMVTMGLWHGLALHYIVYGFYQAAMLVSFDIVGRWNRRRQLVPAGWVSDVAGVILTFNLFTFGVLIFSGHLFS
jgi:membrane protein involved in D-alanine export